MAPNKSGYLEWDKEAYFRGVKSEYLEWEGVIDLLT